MEEMGVLRTASALCLQPCLRSRSIMGLMASKAIRAEDNRTGQLKLAKSASVHQEEIHDDIRANEHDDNVEYGILRTDQVDSIHHRVVPGARRLVVSSRVVRRRTPEFDPRQAAPGSPVSSRTVPSHPI